MSLGPPFESDFFCNSMTWPIAPPPVKHVLILLNHLIRRCCMSKITVCLSLNLSIWISICLLFLCLFFGPFILLTRLDSRFFSLSYIHHPSVPFTFQFQSIYISLYFFPFSPFLSLFSTSFLFHLFFYFYSSFFFFYRLRGIFILSAMFRCRLPEWWIVQTP